jgi:pimeloyl-ACP methyl ester carboxylesterase
VPSQEYAASVADQVRRLLGQGVPAGHISVIGHSKGGQMTLMVAAILANDAINYVIMAGCGQKNTEYRSGYEKFLKNKASRMKGRILSLYDEVDRTAGTCDEAFSLAKLQEQKEKVLLTGRGHGLFYAPEDEWIDAVVEWVGR